MSDDSLAETAAALLDRSGRNPQEVLDRVGDLLDDDLCPDDIRVELLFARGRSEHELGNLPAALTSLAAGADLAARLGRHDREGHIRGSLALSAYTHGDTTRAEAELAVAAMILEGADRARVVMQRAIMQVHEGDLVGGLDSFNQALPSLEAAGDDIAAARLLVSRGVAHALLGRLDEAEADYRRGAEEADRIGEVALAASARANLAHTLGRRGDVPAALRWFDRAREDFAAVGDPHRYLVGLETDLCEVLLDAGLHDESLAAAERALNLAALGENRVQEGEASLLLAKALLGAGSVEAAAAEAERADERFAAAGRMGWVPLARFAAVVADSGSDRTADAAALLPVIDGLAQAGWSGEAEQARTMRVVALVESGQIDLARDELASLGTGHGTPGLHRSRAWLATALVRRADGDITGARRAVMNGVNLVDEHRALLGATELRLLVAEHRHALVDLGLELAIERGRLSDVFVWAERARQGALSIPAALPPDDVRLGESVAEFRRATARKTDALSSGVADPELDRAVASAERAVRDATRLVDGRRPGGARPPDLAAVRDRVGGRVLLQFHESAGRLGVISVSAGRSRRLDLAAVAEVRERVTALYFTLRRLASGFGSTAGRQAAEEAVWSDARWLQRTLLDVVPGVSSAAEIVVVPSESLIDVPWSVCPLASKLPIVVAPSVGMWCRTDIAAPRSGAGTVAVAGPGLDAAQREMERIRRVGSRVSVLAGDDATVDAVTAALPHADIAHIAAHGTFRQDSPLFSSLALADGELTVYDIERLRASPRCVVLAACHAGRGRVGRSGEMMGTAAALVRSGAGAVIAPLVAVADQASADLMPVLHEAFARNVSPAVALTAMIDAAGESGLAAWTARAYVCTGVDTGA